MLRKISLLKKISAAAFFSYLLLFSNNLFCQTPPPAQTAGGIEQQEQAIQIKKKLEEIIKKTKVKPPEILPEEKEIKKTGRKVFIKNIAVEGTSLVTPQEIKKIASNFTNKELYFSDMQEITRQLTNLYRRKGFITSFAYIPPQKLTDNILTINILEGKLGELKIKGNRYSKTSSLKKKIKLAPQGYFDYSALQQSLIYINDHPDRTARATLVPGKEIGTTDIIIEVEDRFPIHIGAEYDNAGSRYVNKNRYALVIEHNNLLGFDDQITCKLQQSESDFYLLKSANYIFPIGNTAQAGIHFSYSKLKLGKEFKDVESKGTAQIMGLFFNKTLFIRENLNLRTNFGFDYKNIENFLLGETSSKDKIRLFKTGLDLDINDKLGRSLILIQLHTGIPRIFEGLDSKDTNASRPGAGGKFTKGVFNIFRLQPMPFSSTLLIKNSAQYSNYTLAASEQFQLGGAASVRGYPPGEYSGDKGIFSSLEWSFPSYFVPKNITIPFTNENLFQALRFIIFYDWATTHLNKVLSEDKQHQTLKGYGFGIRFNLKDNIFARIELAYPNGKTPSDGDRMHPWIRLNWKF